MADSKYDENSNDQLNPAETAQRLREQEEKNTFDEENNSRADSSPESVRESEQNPQQPSQASHWNYRQGKDGAKKITGKANFWKKKGPLAIIIAILGGGSGISVFFFTGFLAPLAWGENVVDDLNDQLAALEIREHAILRTKVSNVDRDKALAGCSKMSIRCKFRTMSNTQVRKLERAGITVTKSTEIGFGESTKRIRPEEFTFRNKTYSPREFAEAIGRTSNNTALKNAYKRGINMKFIGVNDKTFVGRVLARWGLTRKPPELTGTHQERVDAMMNRAGVYDLDNIKFVPADADEDGNPRWQIEGDDSGKTWTDAEKIEMEKSVDSIKTSRPPSRVKSFAIKAIGVVGVYDLACSLSNMIGMASVAAKVANSKDLAMYAMNAASMTGAMKAGDLSYEDSLVLQEYFNGTDNREYVVDVSKAFEAEGVDEDGNAESIKPIDGETPMMKNPYYGKSMMDSVFYQLSETGKLGKVSPEAAMFSLGAGQSTLLSNVSNIAEVTNVLTNLGGAGACDFVQNWAVRSVSLVAGIVLGVFSGGTSLAIQAGIAVGIIAAMIITESMLNNALTGNVIHEEMSDAPFDRAAAQWTGTGVVLGEASRSRGMIPGNTEEILAYQTLNNEVKQEYIAMEKEYADPFDIYNQYSFLGMFARSVGEATNWSSSLTSPITNISSLVTGAIPAALRPSLASAKTDNPARFEVCDDEAYTDLDINPDIQCNIRYVMYPEDLELDTDTVAAYMEENGYVETETTTGMPEGYTPPNPEVAENFATSLITGFVDQFYETRNYGEAGDDGEKYGEFLDFCAYRSMPWGETFEEASGWNAADKGWVTGEKCMEKGEPYNYFRAYTFDISTQAGLDDDPVETYTTEDNTGTVSESPVIIASGEWAKPNATGFNKITQQFGNPVSYNSGYPIGGGRYGHNGIDLAGSQKSEKVYAACNGSAVSTRVGEYTYANTIVVDCGGGITVGYHHAKLTTGGIVTAGQEIGYTDLSGMTTGHHLHLTVKVNGAFVEPVAFFKGQGINLP